jgi:predicted acyl esterase
MRLTVWLSMDVPDTDLHAVVYELTADGRSIRLGEDVMRARYRESLAKEAPVPPGVAVRYDLDRFYWFARRIGKGSRIRLLFGALSSPEYEKNYNSGGPVADESGKDARVAHVTLLHDAAHPSVLELPVGR